MEFFRQIYSSYSDEKLRLEYEKLYEELRVKTSEVLNMSPDDAMRLQKTRLLEPILQQIDLVETLLGSHKPP